MCKTNVRNVVWICSEDEIYKHKSELLSDPFCSLDRHVVYPAYEHSSHVWNYLGRIISICERTSDYLGQ